MTSFFERLKNSKLAQSAAIASICILIYSIGPVSSFETNDDVYYSLVFSGKLVTSAPDPHAVFVNFVLSDIFAKLYTFFPDVPWYGMFHIVSIISSVFFINYFYSIAHSNSKFWLRLAVSLAGALPFLFLIQFTKTAFVLAVTGYLGLYLLNDATLLKRRHNIFLHTVAVSFLLLSFSLRKESFLLATILCSFLLISALQKKKKAFATSIAAVTVLVLAFSLIHKYNYGTEWQNFFTLQKTIGPILDYDRMGYEENSDVFTKVGLSRNDYYFLKMWAHADERVYSKERLKYIYDNAKKTKDDIQVVSALQSAVSFPAKNYILIAAGLALLMLLIYRQQYSLLCVCVLIPLLICCSILIWQVRFPTRVSTAMIYFLPWAILVSSGSPRKQWVSVTVAITAILVLAIPIYGQFNDLSEIARYRQFQNSELHRFGSLLSKTPITLVTVGPSFPYEGILPFESADYLSRARFICLGGMNQSPVQKKQLAENDINDIFEALITEKTAYINLDPALGSFLQKYISEHYQKQVSVTPVYTSSSFTIYRLMAL